MSDFDDPQTSQDGQDSTADAQGGDTQDSFGTSSPVDDSGDSGDAGAGSDSGDSGNGGNGGGIGEQAQDAARNFGGEDDRGN